MTVLIHECKLCNVIFVVVWPTIFILLECNSNGKHANLNVCNKFPALFACWFTCFFVVVAEGTEFFFFYHYLFIDKSGSITLRTHWLELFCCFAIRRRRNPQFGSNNVPSNYLNNPPKSALSSDSNNVSNKALKNVWNNASKNVNVFNLFPFLSGQEATPTAHPGKNRWSTERKSWHYRVPDKDSF